MPGQLFNGSAYFLFSVFGLAVPCAATSPVWTTRPLAIAVVDPSSRIAEESLPPPWPSTESEDRQGVGRNLLLVSVSSHQMHELTFSSHGQKWANEEVTSSSTSCFRFCSKRQRFFFVTRRKHKFPLISFKPNFSFQKEKCTLR